MKRNNFKWHPTAVTFLQKNYTELAQYSETRKVMVLPKGAARLLLKRFQEAYPGYKFTNGSIGNQVWRNQFQRIKPSTSNGHKPVIKRKYTKREVSETTVTKGAAFTITKTEEGINIFISNENL